MASPLKFSRINPTLWNFLSTRRKALNSLSSVHFMHTIPRRHPDNVRLHQTLSQPWVTGNLDRRSFSVSPQINKSVSFILADIGEGITEVAVKEWYVKEGDRVAQFDNVCEVQSDKASVTITSRYDGVIAKLHYAVDDVARVGKPLFDVILDNAEAAPDPDAENTGSGAASVSETAAQERLRDARERIKVLATPAVRRIAAEYKVDLKNIRGTGKDGRVMKEDVLAFLDQTQSEVPSALKTGPKQPIQQTFSSAAEDKVVPIQGFIKAMVKTMSLAQQVPHFVYCDEIDVTALYELRQQLKSGAERRGVKLTFMPFIMKAVSMGLSEFPGVNASVNEDCTLLTLKGAHNIGVAVDSPGGLIVPNVKNVQNLHLLQIGQQLNRLQAEAMAGTLKQQDLTGGTFTLSNIGAIGGTYASPVLLVPEVAIGAVGKIQTLPRFSPSGQVVPVKIMNVSWAADHRVLDGATISRFSNRVKQLLENPQELLL